MKALDALELLGKGGAFIVQHLIRFFFDPFYLANKIDNLLHTASHQIRSINRALTNS